MLTLFAGLAIERLCVERLRAPDEPELPNPGSSSSIAGGRIMLLKKVAYTAVFVKDQDNALDFYTKVLGFEKGTDSPTPGGPRFVTIGVKDQDFQLVLWPGTHGQGQPAYGRVCVAYTIEVSDCRQMFQALKSRGVKFETEVEEHPWGQVAVFQDPDGNVLQLLQYAGDGQHVTKQD
jgi:predicted enzyme related to lactoylglutathione lyase